MADGRLYGAEDSMLTLAELVTMVAAWIADYHDRPHAGLHGATPRQAWLADSTPIREVPPEQLRGLLHRESRRLGKYGIRVDNVWYLPPKLFGARGQVQVRYDKHAPTELLVYVNGVYADTAFPRTQPHRSNSNASMRRSAGSSINFVATAPGQRAPAGSGSAR